MKKPSITTWRKWKKTSPNRNNGSPTKYGWQNPHDCKTSDPKAACYVFRGRAYCPSPECHVEKNK